MPSHILRLTGRRSWAAVLVALFATVAGATVVVHETIDAMARRVPVIVRGKVVRSMSGWDASKRRIWTWTELVVTDRIKGKVGGSVLVKQPGGVVGPVGQQVAGVATFQEGEDCVLFLDAAPDEPGTWRPSGLSAGKVELREWLGEPTALRRTDGLTFARPAGAVVEVVQSPELLGTPETFIRRVRAAAGGAP